MTALSSYQQVRQRNEDKSEDHAKLRRQMLESQSDPQAVIEQLATNMGFWLLGQQPTPSDGGHGGDFPHPAMAVGGNGGGGLSEPLEKTLAAIAAATGEGEEAASAEMLVGALRESVKGGSRGQVEELKRQLEASENEKLRMEEQLKATEDKVDDLSSNLRDYSQVGREVVQVAPSLKGIDKKSRPCDEPVATTTQTFTFFFSPVGCVCA
jgi:hypothetical protein